MSTPLQPVITKVGLAAIWNATSTGLSGEITHVVLGSAGYTPDNGQKTLRNQVAKYRVSGGEKLSDTLIHVTALADGPGAFWVREIGFLLSDGTLLAVWSHETEPLTYKPSGTDLLLAYDLSLAALPADSVTIVSSPAGLNLTLSAPLAALASSLLSEQLRGLQRSDQLTDLEQQHRIVVDLTTRRLDDLTERLAIAEQRSDGLLSIGISTAEAVLSEQLRGLGLQDQISVLSRQLLAVIEQAVLQEQRVSTAERRHAVDHDGLLSMGIAAAEANISTQTKLFKINGA